MTNLVYYSQEDTRWKNVMYSNHGDKTQTIGTSGCGPTSAAMAISSLTGLSLLPTTAAAYAVSNGYRTYNDGTAWGYFSSIAKKYGVECKQTGSLDTAKTALAAGALVVASMQPGHFTGGGHYILLVGISQKSGTTWIDVYDPNHDNTKYGSDGLVDQGVRNDGKVSAKESVFKNEARQYWIITKGEEEMTAAEKQAFEDLQKTVKELQETIKKQAEKIADFKDSEPLVAAPAWFIKEFGSANLNGKISEPKLTAEGWRVLAISLRANK